MWSQDLRDRGIREIVMLTGDRAPVAEAVAQRVGIEHYVAEAFPADKLAMVKQLQEEGYTVAVVGDGINDSPALAQADVGIAVNGGTALAQETADVVILQGDLEKLIEAIEIAREGVALIRQNWDMIRIPNTIGLGLAFAGARPGGRLADQRWRGAGRRRQLAAAADRREVGAEARAPRSAGLFGPGWRRLMAVSVLPSAFVPDLAAARSSTLTVRTVNYEVVHHVDGRIRVNIPRLGHDAKFSQRLVDAVSALPGVRQARVNRGSSSLVVIYNEAPGNGRSCSPRPSCPISQGVSGPRRRPTRRTI